MGIDHSNPYIHSTTVLCDTNTSHIHAYNISCRAQTGKRYFVLSPRSVVWFPLPYTVLYHIIRYVYMYIPLQTSLSCALSTDN